MQGYVLSFHPVRRFGTIVTDSGEAISFSLSPSDRELHGGDVVVFELDATAEPKVPGVPPRLVDWEVVGSGSDQFAAFRNPLIKEFYRSVRIDPPTH